MLEATQNSSRHRHAEESSLCSRIRLRPHAPALFKPVAGAPAEDPKADAGMEDCCERQISRLCELGDLLEDPSHPARHPGRLSACQASRASTRWPGPLAP